MIHFSAILHVKMQNRFSLKQYSTAAAALLAPAAVFSQAVYTDVDPDIVLDEPGEWWGFDLDGDGLNDFNFFNTLINTYIWPLGDASAYRIWAGAFDNSQNCIAGSRNSLFGPYSSIFYQYYPFVFDQEYIIDSNLAFEKWGYQRLAFQTFFTFDYSTVSIYGGNWFPEQLDRFLGVKYYDNDEKIRYGWIRCSVIDSGRTLIIHDYAYESKPDTPILTGDTIGDTTTVNIQEGELLGITVYGFGNSVFINTSLNSVQYRILNLHGEVITEGFITSGSSKLELSSVATGIYLMECRQGQKRLTHKVFIEN